VEQAVKAVGDGDSLTGVLDTLKAEGVIESYNTILELRVDRDKAVAVENFFMLKDFDKIVTQVPKRRKPTND